MSARLPTSIEPVSSARRSEYAPLSVAAVSDSSTVSFICSVASWTTVCIDSVIDEPGLQSVERETTAPFSMSLRAGAYRGDIRKKLVAGRRFATVSDAASASMPRSEMYMRWSAEAAPMLAASAAPSVSESSSACRRGIIPSSAPARSTASPWSRVKTPRSTKASLKTARFSSATAGRISPMTVETYPARAASLPRLSGGNSCAARHVGTRRTGDCQDAVRIARSCLSSHSLSSPYPLFASAVVVPYRAIVAARARTFATRSSSAARRVAWTVEAMPPPDAAICS